MATFVSEAFKELKKHVESLGLDEKSKSKFLMKEWRKMRETAVEEGRLQAEQEAAAEETRLLAEREVEEKRAKQEAEEKRAKRKAEEKRAERDAGGKPPWNWND